MNNTQTIKTIHETLFNVIKNIGDKSTKPYVILNQLFKVIYQSDLHEQLTKYSFEQLKDKKYSDFIGNNKTKEQNILIEKALENGKIVEIDIVHKKFKDISFTSRISAIPFQTDDHHTSFVLVILEDVTTEKLKQSIIRLEQNLLTTIDIGTTFEEKMQEICKEINYIFSPHCFATIAWDLNDYIQLFTASNVENLKSDIKLTKQQEEYFTYKNLIYSKQYAIIDEVCNSGLEKTHINYALSKNFESAFYYPIQFSTSEKNAVLILYFDEHTKDIQPFNNLFDKLTILMEFSFNYERQKNEIYNLAYYDSTLQIPNRHGMQHFLNLKRNLTEHLFVALLSPTEFPQIVELYGRDAGELILDELVKRLKKCAKIEAILIGRFSSATIYIVLNGNLSVQYFEEELNRIMTEPFKVNKQISYLTLKVGLSKQNGGFTIEDTSRHAEIALSIARKKSGQVLVQYDESYASKMEKELALVNHLTEAIRNKEIQVFFQPKVELHRRRIESMEALARWNSTTLGFISPAEFIPIAERAGLIHKIDVFIIEQVLTWQQKRLYEGKKIVPVSVNISPEHFYHPNFVDDLIVLVQKYYADPKYLIIEITESLGLVDIDKARQIIDKLNLKGFIVSVDDFGMGYSSLSYLQKLLFRELKIDMSFVSRLHEEGTLAIVRSIIHIAKYLEMIIIAEGVETEEQAQILKELGCDAAQGYLFYKPMPIQEAEKIL